MSKRLILILALVFVAAIAVSAYAEVQNVKVSGDITMQGVQRNSLSLQDPTTATGFAPLGYGENISAILSAVRVKIDADLTDNVSTCVRLLSERAWGVENDAADDTDMDLDLAYVTLKEFLYSPLTLTLGRQNLRFGNALVIGDVDTNGLSAGSPLVVQVSDLSLRKSFDAMRATLDYDPLVVDLVYAKIDEVGAGLAAASITGITANDDTDLYGINAAYAVNSDLNTEAYLWQRSRNAGAAMTMNDAEDLRTAGVRAVYSGIENTSLGAEVAYQFGDHVATTNIYPDEGQNTGVERKVNAYAIQLTASRAMPDMKYNPVINGSYTFLSGDKYRSVADDYKGWDPMYEDQGSGTLFNKILGYSNAQLFNIGASMKPKDDVTVDLNYYHLRLVQTYSAAQSTVTGLTLTGVPGGPNYKMTPGESSLGNEVDLGVTYDYTEDVQIGLNTGAFIPGDAFHGDNDKTATQVIGSMKVTF